MKAVREDSTIAVYVQESTEVSDGWFKKLDANGDVVSKVVATHMVYDEPYRSCGVIEIGDAWVGLCPMSDLDKLIFGAQRHVVHLIAAGFGNRPNPKPDDVAGWFADLLACDFIAVDTDYPVIGSGYGFLAGLRGHRLRFKATEEDTVVGADGKVGGDIDGFGTAYPFSYDPQELVAPLLISTIPT